MLLLPDQGRTGVEDAGTIHFNCLVYVYSNFPDRILKQVHHCSLWAWEGTAGYRAHHSDCGPWLEK